MRGMFDTGPMTAPGRRGTLLDVPEQLNSSTPAAAWGWPWRGDVDGVELEDLCLTAAGASHVLPIAELPAGPHALAPSMVPRLRDGLKRLYDEMIDSIVRGSGLDDVARLAAGAAGTPVAIILPSITSTVMPPGTMHAEELAGIEAWVGERDRGRPTPARDDVVAEVPVSLRGQIVGLVALMRGPASPHPDAPWVLDVVAAAAVTALAIDDARLETESRLRGAFLEQLRTGDQLSRVEIIRRALRLGCDVSRGAVAVCVEVDGNRPRLVATTVSDECPGAFAELVGPLAPGEAQQVWAVLPAAAGDDPAAATQAVAQRLAARLRQYGTVGISRFHEDPLELTRGIDEALLMLEVLGKVAAPSGDEIVNGTYKLLFRLLASHPEELTSYHGSTIGPLATHDDQYRTDLVHTLEVYLDSNCNMNTTAETIFAHRHTVAHRLERIDELTGLDATTHEGRERLGLGLKIHRLTA